ncbi:MAG: HD family hydrolase, partial [Promethearchaeota archaeon]
MNPNRLAQQMDFIAEIDKLKQVVRESWLIDASRKETDAEHSWHITLMVLLLREYANEPNIDILKVLKMLLIHDIVEIDAGDTF